MNKTNYIEMLLQDNETECDERKKKLYTDVIDCADIALSQTNNGFEVDSSIGLAELWREIENAGRNAKAQCVGPFEAAELIANKLGTKYERVSRRKAIKNLEDFL